MQPVNVLTEILLDVPIAQVAAFVTDPDNAPAWYVNIKSAEWRTEKPLRVGSEIAFVAHFFGRRLAYVYAIKDWIPGQKMVMATADGPFPMETTYTWESLGAAKTRMTLRNAGRPTGFSKLFAPFMARAMRKANEKDLQNLKRLLEKPI